MQRIALVATAAVVALVPATSQAHKRPAGSGEAAKACRAERQADPAAFQKKYANENGKRAFRRCVRRHVRAARKKCREERKADPAAFRQKYANKKGRNAFRRCVRAHADEPVS
jgi:hypothetical protein